VIPIHLSERVQYNSDITKTKEVLKKYQLSKHNYVIFVSQYYPNKNHERLIQAFSDFIEHNKAYSELKLVIVGNMSRSGGIIEKFAHQFNCKNNIIFTERVDNEKLSILLKNALCFVHPSLYEGFGMPVVEAMSCGIPIACSKIPSFLEVVGDAAIFFNPYDVSDIERAMSDIIKSPELRNNLIKKGYEQSKKFKDSHTMTSDYIKVFDEVMNRKKNY
jgi:glycosyltransferase involved in cell wall biosynthesis